MSITRIWQLVPLLIMYSPKVFSDFGVCTRTENYTVTSMRTFMEPVVVYTFTWCLQVPPRCPKTRTEMRQRYATLLQYKTRNVSECCEGYKELSRNYNESSIRCEAICPFGCVHGECRSPNECYCNWGWTGKTCDTPCPKNTWGQDCKYECPYCPEDPYGRTCDGFGRCPCPLGFYKAPHGRCTERCDQGKWGPDCKFECNCDPHKCRPDIGCVSDITIPNENNSTSPQNIEESNVIVNLTWSTETTAKDGVLATTQNSVNTPSLETTILSSTRSQAPEDDNSSTARPVIVLVSVPERRKNMDKGQGKFMMKNSFMRHVDEEEDSRVVGPAKTDYVKNVHKEVHPPVPLDVALIVIASIVSLGLTSVAVVMVLHMRSKLLEGRISIYEESRTKCQENLNASKMSIVNGTLPQSSIRLEPIFASTPDPRTVLTLNNLDCSKYANGAATIGYRLSSNLHGFLQEDHYDRPPSTRMRFQDDSDANTEHVYDEIPLQSSPLSSRENA